MKPSRRTTCTLLLLTASLFAASTALAQPVRETEVDPPFRLEALTDFVDDALDTEFTPAHIDHMMATLADMGVTRVSWAYYGDGHGGYPMPTGLDGRWQTLAATYQGLGNPLRVAVEAAQEIAARLKGK